MPTPFSRSLMAGMASAALLLLSACGGGGGGGDAPATPPTAVARPSQATAPIGTTLTLDGSGSTTPNGGSLTYSWTLSAKPDGSTAALSDATAAKPTLTPDKPGDYVIDLVVKDSRAGSTAARITIPVTNPNPVAVVSPATQAVLQGSTVTLNGSTSLPPTGGAAADLRYEWKLTEQPAGALDTVLVSGTSAKATFTANKLGVYRATLIVRHGDRASVAAQAEVAVNNGNSRPVAKIAAPTTAVRGTTVALDASGSTDADGDTLRYRWSFAPFVANSTNPPRPLGSKASLVNPTSAKAEFVPDAVGKYYIDLVVYDNSVSSTERVIIDVTKPAGAANAAPVAVVGVGRTAEECEVGGYCDQFSSSSYDIDGDALSAKWTFWNTATPTDKRTAVGRDLSDLSYGSSAGTWQVQLVVNDGQADSAVAEQSVVIKTGANRAPFAKSKVDAGTVLVGETIWFDATGSNDRDGDPLTYEWTLIDRPDGSSATLRTPNALRASVVTDKPGRYRAQLKVTDPKGWSRSIGTDNFAQAFAKAQNNAPVVANLRLWQFTTPAADQPLVIRPVTENGVTRNGVGSSVMATIFDPDLDTPLYYILTATRYPAGSSFTKSVSGQAASGSDVAIGDPAQYSNFFFSLPGDYEFQLVASDGAAYSETKKLNFSIVTPENYPGVLLEHPSNGQLVWPLASYLDAGALNFDFDTAPRELGTYRLYAADRDYTVADLVASATNSALAPSFVGLRNGQVIRKGETVTFTLTRPAIPNERALMQALYALDQNSDAFKAENARLQKLYLDYRFTWSFRFAERTDRTFYVGPRP